jgi:hypothetical protein
MRLIVVGQLLADHGITQINVWFRFPVIAARQPYYQKLQGNYLPMAPGDYAGADSAEMPGFTNGQFVERAGFEDTIDPTSTLAQIKTRLVNIYAAASGDFKSQDDAALSRWGPAYDGTTWADKSS